MARHRKNEQRYTKGCKLCGNPGFGRGIRAHVEGKHGLEYETYLRCFERCGTVIRDELVQTGRTRSGRRVILHVSLKKFVV